MASTTFVDNQTIIVASWLNDVNNMTYNGVVLSGVLNGSTSLALQTGGLNAITINSSQVVTIGSLTVNSLNFSGNFSVARGIFEVKNIVSNDYTITIGNNAQSIGPMSVAPGKVVTVPSGSRWVVV
jgi:hypothetical protein